MMTRFRARVSVLRDRVTRLRERVLMLRERMTWMRGDSDKDETIADVLLLLPGLRPGQEKGIGFIIGMRNIVSRLVGSQPTTSGKMIPSTKRSQVVGSTRGHNKKAKTILLEQTGSADGGPQDHKVIQP